MHPLGHDMFERFSPGHHDNSREHCGIERRLRSKSNHGSTMERGNLLGSGCESS
jgi:hypothetical protein